MKKVVLIFLSLLICVGVAYSQFDAQLSQYMLHNSSFNPAAVGEGELIQVTGQYRMQWLGMPNAGSSLIFSINSPVKFLDKNHGIGVRFLNESSGLFTTKAPHLQYAYKMKLGDGVLSLGTDLGFTSLGFVGDSVREITSDYHNISGDPEIPKTSVVGTSFDMSLGAFYSTPDYYAGVSCMHLNNPTVEWGDYSSFRQFGTLFLTGGYNWAFADTKYVFKPSTLIKTDFSSWQWDVSGRVEYDNKYWGGLSYRIQDAVTLLAGINIAGGFSIGYSYDFPTTKMLIASWGSHELVCFYSFEYVFGKKNNKYKSIRIL